MSHVKEKVLKQVSQSYLLWEYFYDISQIPRCSFHTQAIQAYIKREADNLGYKWKEDECGNICVRVPASLGREKDEILIFQSHTDMVCEKNEDTVHDFSRDSIKWRIEDNKLYAQQTTLGADNGIGVATMLAIMKDSSFSHPSLECLFTVDEEVGLLGARKMDPNLITGRYLLNLDYGMESYFCMGSAGDVLSVITKEKNIWQVKKEGFLHEISITGLQGGHSGAEIHKKLGNANQLMIKTLVKLLNQGCSFKLVSLAGGNKTNAITRECKAQIWLEEEFNLDNFLKKEYRRLKDSLEEGQDEKLSLSLRHSENISTSLPVSVLEETQTTLNMLDKIPHGVMKMYSEEVAGLSLNFARLYLNNKKGIEIAIHHRSIWKDQLDPMVHFANLKEDLESHGFRWVVGDISYPWEPKKDSLLRKYASAIHKETFGKDPILEATHGGLECGPLFEKSPHLDILSLGPTMYSLHTPEENVEILSVERFWIFIKNFLIGWRGNLT